MTAPVPNFSGSQRHVSQSDQNLVVVLRRDAESAILARERVLPSDLLEARSELWREAYLRRGHLTTPFASMAYEIHPRASEGGAAKCKGFALETTNPDKLRVQVSFTNGCLSSVASRAAERLKDNGILQDGDTYTYEIVLDGSWVDVPMKGPKAPFQITVYVPPLRVLSVPLRPLLKEGAPEGVVAEEAFPVFFTREAYEAAERFSRKGGEHNPPVETGAVLLGPLCYSAHPPELFCVVSEVLEVVEPDSTEFTLSYTSKSWNRIQTIMRARQSVQPAMRMLGQCHGHNFLPNAGVTCEACASRPVCSLDNVAPSHADLQWSRAVFSQQPWQLCLIHGFTARKDRLQRLFTLSDGRLVARGFSVLPEFDPTQWPEHSAP